MSSAVLASGLTCTEQSFITEAGAQRYAAEHNTIVVAPDTSPRGKNVPDDPAYALGKSARFYVNITRQPCVRKYGSQSLFRVLQSHFLGVFRTVATSKE